MAIFLTEADVEQLLSMERAIERIEASFLAQHNGLGENRSRERIFLPRTSLHYMAAGLRAERLLGMKIYTVSPTRARFLVLLFDMQSGKLLALLEADRLGRIRTGAASGVATRYLARQDVARVGLIGTGQQARTQLEAVRQVRAITSARVFGRDQARCRAFCREMADKLQLEVEPTESAEAAVRFGDVVVVATTAREPVVHGEWLRPGTHINAIGANMASRRELDALTLSRASVIAVDSLQQARQEAGDLIQGFAGAPEQWQRVVEMHTIVAGSSPGRDSAEQITLFKSCGIALWDVAAAGYVYRQALEKGKGVDFPIWTSESQ